MALPKYAQDTPSTTSLAQAGGDLSYDPVTPIPGDDVPGEKILGTPGDDMLAGTKIAEYFKAGAGVDRESGYGGNDVFLMGPDRDFIGGGGGSDTAPVRWLHQRL